jgi:apolipoprotein N-acyltransferase
MIRYSSGFLHFLACISGALLGISLLHPLLWPCVFAGVLLTLLVLTKASGVKQVVFLGWIIGAVKVAITLLWFWSAYPLDWLGIDSVIVQILLVSMYWIPAAVTLGAGVALFGYVYHRYLCHIQTMGVYVLSVGCMWVWAEIFGAIVFSIYTIGSGSHIGAEFSFGHTGYALVEYGGLFSLAAFGGVYALSFAVGCMGAMLHRMYTDKNTWLLHVVVGIVVGGVVPVLWVTGYLEQNISVALIETSFERSGLPGLVSSEKRKEILTQAIVAAVDSGTEYIVLPEDSRFTTYFVSTDAVLAYLNSLTDSPMILVDSARFDTSYKTTLRAYVYDTSATEVYFFDKQYLVPQGEYIPYIYQLLIDVLQPEGRLLESLQDTTYGMGTNQKNVALPASIPTVLFCFEGVSPVGVYTVMGQRAEVPFIAHIVSHAWFKRDPYMLWNQLDAMLRTQARMNNIPVLQASNEASVKVYMPSGEVRIPDTARQETHWSLSIINL